MPKQALTGQFWWELSRFERNTSEGCEPNCCCVLVLLTADDLSSELHGGDVDSFVQRTKCGKTQDHTGLSWCHHANSDSRLYPTDGRRLHQLHRHTARRQRPARMNCDLSFYSHLWRVQPRNKMETRVYMCSVLSSALKDGIDNLIDSR